MHAPAKDLPTIWGLDPIQLHDRFWASRGVQVVRQGERSEIVRQAELYLLSGPSHLCTFRLNLPVSTLSWTGAELLTIRLRDDREHGYRERVLSDPAGRFLRFERDYSASESRTIRIALTPDQELARIWQGAPDPRTGWRRLRQLVRREERWSQRASGRVFHRGDDRELALLVRELARTWERPDSAIRGVRSPREGIWADPTVPLPPGATLVGPLWIGAGRNLGTDAAAVGPAVVWDDPAARPVVDDIAWLDLEPSDLPSQVRARSTGRGAKAAKRAFDIAFALVALAATLPLYPLIAAAILIEDGRPVFFRHRRETIGGREFPCLKFRSMRKNAEAVKAQLAAKNEADGPQFYIQDDPRLLRVGRIIRRLQLDELPQFLNVLAGHMSVVGPRPSPFTENQYCPPWREARLSVRPGVTGLWQIKRTRAAGTDFQEWIKYDIEYVEKASLLLDLSIIWRTITMMVRGVTRA